MSDTPRTETYVLNPLPQIVSAEWARQLERELNAASKERDDALMMLGMYRMKSDEQKQRIKRLEEAGDAMADLLEEEMFMKLAVQWRKAKEAKL